MLPFGVVLNCVTLSLYQIYVLYRYLPYMAASGVVFFASASAENNMKAIALPSDLHYMRWALSIINDKSR